LAGRAATVEELAERLRASVGAQQRPEWVGRGGGQPPFHLVGDIEVWRAAMGVSRDDRRPTGPVQRQRAARMWQRRLDEAVACGVAPAWRAWEPLVEQLAPAVRNDSFAPILAGRLAAISGAGLDARQLLRSAADGKPLPDDHAAAALWWRICRHLNPALLPRVNRDTTVTDAWESRLAELIGAERAETVQASPRWPALVTAVDHGLQRGWRLEDLLRPSSSRLAAADVDECQAMLWRISVALDPMPEDEQYKPHPSSRSDALWHASVPLTAESATATRSDPDSAVRPATEATLAEPTDGDHYLEPDLAVAAMLRDVAWASRADRHRLCLLFLSSHTRPQCPEFADQVPHSALRVLPIVSLRVLPIIPIVQNADGISKVWPRANCEEWENLARA